MIDKIKSQVNKTYATIAIYVIITVAIIFALAFATTKIEIIFASVVGIFNNIWKVLTPVFIGLVIAYIVNPMVITFEKMIRKIKFLKFKNNKKYRSLAVFSCIIVILLVMFLLFGAFILSITKQFSSIKINEIINIVTNYINSFSDSLWGIKEKFNDSNIEFKAMEDYITRLSTILIDWLKNFTNNLATYTLNISGYIYNYILGLIIAIYLLLDKDKFLIYGYKLSKVMFSVKTQKRIKSYWKDFDFIFSDFIRGQLLDVLFMCVVLSVVLSIIGIKFGVLIGIFAGVCNLIPYFGPIVAFIGIIFFGVINAQYSQVVIAIIVLLIVQQIDATIVEPKLLGNSVYVKPVFILITVLIGAHVGGVLGMVLAVPIAALVGLFMRRYIEARLAKKDLLINNNNTDIK